MKRPKQIMLITPGQPSSNPRLLKEAVALWEEGYGVTVLYNFWTEWASAQDRLIKERYDEIQWIEAGGHPKSSAAFYLYTRVRHKIDRFLNQLFPSNLFFAERAEARGYLDLLRYAKKRGADLYIAHNLAALPVAAKAARKHKVPFAFDAEDFHRGQVAENSRCHQRIRKIEETWLANAAYISAASKPIAEKYRVISGKKVTVIHNVFSKTWTPAAERKPGRPLKLFWFSQTIGEGRGLEDVFFALKGLPVDDYRLTLLGSLSPAMEVYFNRLAEKEDGTKIRIQFLPPVHPDEIFSIAARHDIGLALEPGRDLNNQLALSNKIFTYLLAGNAVIFSSTPAQEMFYRENHEVGFLYACGKGEELAKALSEYSRNPELLVKHQKEARRVAEEKYNWEKEKEKLLQLVANTISCAKS